MNKPIVLLVEDELVRRDEFRQQIGDKCVLTMAEDALVAISLIRSQVFDYIFLDHDLGHGLNGMDIVRCMYRSVNSKTPVLLHSLNRRAAIAMSMDLQEMGIPCTIAGFLSEGFWENVMSFITF